MSEKISIIVIHAGNQDYLGYCLKQAKKSNPDSRIILLGDDSNNCYDFIEHYNINDFKGTEFDEFATIYKHFSPNIYKWELLCIQRWFIIKNFLKQHNISRCFHIDSDVLLYGDLEKEAKIFENYDYTLTIISPHSMFINNLTTLEKFCSYVMDCYKNPDVIKEFERYYNDNLKAGDSQGISDMQLLEKFGKLLGPNKMGYTEKFINNSTFDPNICHSYGFKMKNNLKDIFFKNHQPYGIYINQDKQKEDIIRLNTLHLQGKNKAYMEFLYKYEKISILSVVKYKFKKESLRIINQIKGLFIKPKDQ